MTHSEKLPLIAQWLRDEGWTPGVFFWDYHPTTKRAQEKFKIRDSCNARLLVHKAARMMQGQAVPMAGRPVKVTAITRNGHTLQWSSGAWHVDGKEFATRKEAMAIFKKMKKEKE